MIQKLEQMSRLWREIDSLQTDLQELKDIATDPSTAKVSTDKVQCSKDVNKLNVVEKYLSVERDNLTSKKAELSELVDWLRGYLDRMDNQSERNVLSQVYIMNHSIDRIAESLGYSHNHVYKLLRAGKESLAKRIQDDTH